jgi:hypothetical protein
MDECPHCEYNKKRAQNWREEAYRLAGHPLPEREWVGLTDEEIVNLMKQFPNHLTRDIAQAIEAKLKEKNT